MNPTDGAFEPFTDRNGFVHTKAVNPLTGDPTTRNGVTYTSQAYIIRHQRGELLDFERERFGAILRQCFRYRDPKDSTQVLPGLMARGPTIDDQEGPDDYIWATAAGALLGIRWIPHNVLYHAQTNPLLRTWGPIFSRYVYNNLKPRTMEKPDGTRNMSAWLGRFPGVIAHFHFCAGREPGWFLRPAWRKSLALTAAKGHEDQDGWSQNWAMVQVYFKMRQLGLGDAACDRAVAAWCRRFREVWGSNGMRNLERIYLQSETHPFTLYWEDQIP